VSDSALSPDDRPDPGDELLDLEHLVAAGLERDEARAVLGPHTCLPRREIAERLELLRWEREGRR
jgi:hypothetical protein